MQKIFLASLLTFSYLLLSAQTSFTNKTSQLVPGAHYSGVAIAIIDANGDGLDDIVRMNQGYKPNIQYQTTPNSAFHGLDLGTPPGTTGSQWGMCTADVDNNGYADILLGGYYDGVKIAKASADGASYAYTNLTQPSTFVQGVNFADINNDGWLDAFVCHDDGAARIYGNNGDGTFTYQPVWMNLSTTPASDNSGNYGSIWTDFDNDGDVDLYIAHCRQGVNDPTDPRRINQLYVNNGDGTYTQDVTNVYGLRIGAQSWTADFGDIDNDGDFDCFITNHDVSSQLLLNDGTGHFTDITAASGLQNVITGQPLEGVFRDFDNDGFVDILVAGTYQYLFHNNGDHTFSQLTGVFDNHQMESFAIGDLNHDGFQDIYAGYAQVYTDPSNTPDAVWINNGNSNHFIGFSLRGMVSNRSGVGARVTVYSAMGTQIREVRSGESYGISNSLITHFGLGQVEHVDSVVINWPSGTRDVIYEPETDKYHTIAEGGCLVPEISLNPLGPTTFCNGQSVNIEAPAGFTYLWNTGDTSKIISAGSPGNYNVTITTPEGCTAVSGNINVVVDPIEPTFITAQSDTIFCSGGSVMLTSNPGNSYLWNTGDTTQNIIVSTSGLYSVSREGLCNSTSSAPIHVLAIEAIPPVLSADSIAVVDSVAFFHATGTNVLWYADSTGGAPIGTGPFFSTPKIGETTTYWVSTNVNTDMPNEFVGMSAHSGSATSDNTYNGGLYFDCYSQVTLSKTKVYSLVEGDRKIDLFDNNLNLVATKTVHVPAATTTIDLDFTIPPGLNYLLTTDPAVNQASIGTAGPQFRRSNQGVHFPYEIPGYISINNSTLDQTRYYYFFNWEIDFPGVYCESDRYPVVAVFETQQSAANEPVWAKGLQLFPNPTSGLLTFQMRDFSSQNIRYVLRSLDGSALRNGTFAGMNATLDLSALPRGLYLLQLAGEDGSIVRKITIQ